MQPLKPHKKSYKTIKNEKVREAIAKYAIQHDTQKALDKYGISIATLKRWRAAYNANKTLATKYYRRERIYKYPQLFIMVKQFEFDNRKHSIGPYGMRGWTKKRLFQQFQWATHPPISIPTAYRIYKEAMEIIKNPQTNHSIPWH
jgi:transposase